MTSPRARVLAVLFGRTPDRVPWMADLGCWYSRQAAAGRLPRPYLEPDGIFRLHRDLEVGFYLPAGAPFSVDFEGVKLVEKTGEGRTSTEVVTPVGSIRQVSIDQPELCAAAIEERFIKSVADLRPLRCWYEHAVYRPQYAAASDRLAQIGEAGIVVCCMPASPLVELAAVLAGVPMLSRASAEAPGELEETLALMERKADEAAAIAVSSPAECLVFREDAAGDPVDSRLYQRFAAPWLANWARRIREAGKRSLVRVNGTLKDLAEQVAATGVDVVEAVAPEVFRARRAGGAVVWGGLPADSFTSAAGNQQFDDLLLSILDVARSSNRYVVGVVGRVPAGARWDRLKRVGELIESHGSCVAAGR